MAKGNRVGIKGSKGIKNRQREEDTEESDEEYKVTEDEECDESDECYSFDGDESEEILADFEPSKRVARSRNTRRTSSGKKENEMIKPRKRRRVLYTEDDDADDVEEVADEDDDAELMSFGRKTNQIKKPTRKKMVSDTDVDDDDVKDDAECMSLGRKTNHRKKPAEKKRFSDTEMDDNDDEDVDDDYNEEEEEEEEEEDCTAFVSSSRKRNYRKKPQEKRDLYAEENEHEHEDEDDGVDEDDDEFRYSGRKANQKKKLREKRKISYTEDDEDEDEDEDDYAFMPRNRKRNQKKKLRENRKISYTEDDEDEDDEDEDDYAFMPRSRKRNQVMESREKSIVSYKEDNEEEDDEKDAEFKLSESDFVDDEEEETPKMKKNDKVTKSRPYKKTVQGGWITVKKSNIKKPTRAKQRNHRTVRVRNKNQDEKQSKKISKRRKQRSVVESDSDFVSSASSDHEYTISEEEREQMKEARVYCANLRAKIRSSSCGNQQEQPCKQRKYLVRKGKEKIEEMKDEAGKQVCGICLSEEGKRTVQGVLNCCRHYFCFSCIMEWSKVESRCPLCKQRFATITKAAKSDTGFDLRTVVIPVPECDQVYQPSEEEVRGYLDPYESVICSECHNGGDDALMLLCDVCDSSAHTFCVGLGQEVPEGNWYCEGCRPTVQFGSLNSQQPTPPTTSDRRLSSNASELSSPVAGGFDLNELYVPETPLTQQTREPRHPVGEFNPAPNGTGATTLRDRRRIHRHIHHRLINNNNNNNRTLASSSSSGIRLFGSQLDQTITISQRAADPRASFIGREDHIIRSARADRFGVQVQNSNFPFVDESLEDEHGGSGMGFNSRFGYAQLRPCNNRSSIGTDACREVIGPSRTSQGGLHAP